MDSVKYIYLYHISYKSPKSIFTFSKVHIINTNGYNVVYGLLHLYDTFNVSVYDTNSSYKSSKLLH